MHPIVAVWPLFGLSVRVDDLELRYPTDTDLAALAALAADGVHDPAVMPFSTPWTDAPPEERGRGTVRWHWQTRATWSPDVWRLSLATVVGGQVAGVQDLAASSFAVTREVESGSWLGRPFQGRGIGTRMRAAVLDLAFTGLGAATARSGGFTDNPASLRVSAKLGYRADGTETWPRRGRPATVQRALLTRQDWEAGVAGRPASTIVGLEPCLAMFGV